MGGCLVGDTSDPGNLQFDWLEVQLEMFRARQMQVRGILLSRCDKITRRSLDRCGSLVCLYSEHYIRCDAEFSGHVPPSDVHYFPECVSAPVGCTRTSD